MIVSGKLAHTATQTWEQNPDDNSFLKRLSIEKESPALFIKDVYYK